MISGLVRPHYVVLLPPMHVRVERVRSRAGHGVTDPGATPPRSTSSTASARAPTKTDVAQRDVVALTHGHQVHDDPSEPARHQESSVTTRPALVMVRDIPVQSVREHHMLPFVGVAHIGYLPRDRILGLSKFRPGWSTCPVGPRRKNGSSTASRTTSSGSSSRRVGAGHEHHRDRWQPGRRQRGRRASHSRLHRRDHPYRRRSAPAGRASSGRLVRVPRGRAAPAVHAGCWVTASSAAQPSRNAVSTAVRAPVTRLTSSPSQLTNPTVSHASVSLTTRHWPPWVSHRDNTATRPPGGPVSGRRCPSREAPTSMRSARPSRPIPDSRARLTDVPIRYTSPCGRLLTRVVSAPTAPTLAAPPGEPKGATRPVRVSLKKASLSAR